MNGSYWVVKKGVIGLLSKTSNVLKGVLKRFPKSYVLLASLRVKGQVVVESIHATAHYLRWAGPLEGSRITSMSEANRSAQLLKDAHRVEKGLSITETKRPFGDSVSTRIRNNLSNSADLPDEISEAAEEAIKALTLWNERAVKDPEIAIPIGHFNLGEGIT